MRQRLAALALQGAGLGGRTYFAFLRATRFVFELGWGHFSLVLFGNGFTRLYGRGVPADVTDELLAQGVFDHARMHALHQLAGGKLGKRPAEGGLAWHGKTQIEAAQPAQFAVGLQTLYQRSGGQQTQYRFG